MAPAGITRPLIIWCLQFCTCSNTLYETKQASEDIEPNPTFMSHKNFNCVIPFCNVNAICPMEADTDW